MPTPADVEAAKILWDQPWTDSDPVDGLLKFFAESFARHRLAERARIVEIINECYDRTTRLDLISQLESEGE